MAGNPKAPVANDVASRLLPALAWKNQVALGRRMDVTILPPVPAFYNHPQTIDDVVNHIVQRVLDQFDIYLDVAARSRGVMVSGFR